MSPPLLVMVVNPLVGKDRQRDRSKEPLNGGIDPGRGSPICDLGGRGKPEADDREESRPRIFTAAIERWLTSTARFAAT